jgi:hypothetical protein
MKAEVLIYAYLAVCAAMICFNIVCIFVFHMKDKRLERYSSRFIKIVERVIEDGEVTDKHCKYLSRKLKKINNLMAFDRTLEELFDQEPDQTREYLKKLLPVFTFLALEYRKKSEIQAAYFPYIIHRYQVFQGQPISLVMDTMLELVHSPSLYVRENALQAIYSTGNVDCAINALRMLDESSYYHHPKMITDGLLNFSGDTKQLGKRLWDAFDLYSKQMQRVIVDYFRFSSADHQERILQLLTSQGVDDEIAYSCIRYLGKYAYSPAYPVLIDIIEKHQHDQWIYTAITASALSGSPGDRTVAVLKELLHNPNWHVRANASQSLMALGVYYTDVIDVFEGHDRYAGEILRYRFDQKNMQQKEAVELGLDRE